MNEHLAFTGTKDGVSMMQHKRLTEWFPKLLQTYKYMHNGDCIGSDSIAFDLWTRAGGIVILHPPINPKYRAFKKCEIMLPEGEYLARDKEMVNSASFLIATPKCPEYLRSGTWSTVRYARKVGIRIMIIYRDGSIVYEDAKGISSLLYDSFN